MKKLVIAGVFALACVPGHAAKEDMTSGHYWYKECSTKSVGCASFILGLNMGIVAQAAISKSPMKYCETGPITIGLMTDLFLKTIEDNPHIKELPAPYIFITSMAMAFPCPK